MSIYQISSTGKWNRILKQRTRTYHNILTLFVDLRLTISTSFLSINFKITKAFIQLTRTDIGERRSHINWWHDQDFIGHSIDW